MTIGDLMTSIEELESEAIEFIKANANDRPYIFYFSGGKDSIIVRYLLQKSKMPYSGIYKSTGMEPENLLDFIKKCEDISIEYPEKSYIELVREHEFLPTVSFKYCCSALVEKWEDFYGQINVSGVTIEPWRKNISRMRFKNGLLYHICPIIHWTEEDRMRYIAYNNIEILPKKYSRNCEVCPINCVMTEERMGKISSLSTHAKLREASDLSFDILTAKNYLILAKDKDEYFRMWCCKEKLVGGVESIVKIL